MAKKMEKWERERAQAKAILNVKRKLIDCAAEVVESLWKSAQSLKHADGKAAFTDAEHEAIADASYHLRSLKWINNKRR